MPKARNRYDRCSQALQWMQAQWPVGRPLQLVWKDVCIDYETGKPDPEILGQTLRDGKWIVIEMKRRHCRDCLMSTLRHEFAHAVLWGHASVEFDVEAHPPHMGSLLWEIENLWNEIGHEEADEYDP